MKNKSIWRYLGQYSLPFFDFARGIQYYLVSQVLQERSHAPSLYNDGGSVSFANSISYSSQQDVVGYLYAG